MSSIVVKRLRYYNVVYTVKPTEYNIIYYLKKIEIIVLVNQLASISILLTSIYIY